MLPNALEQSQPGRACRRYTSLDFLKCCVELLRALLQDGTPNRYSWKKVYSFLPVFESFVEIQILKFHRANLKEIANGYQREWFHQLMRQDSQPQWLGSSELFHFHSDLNACSKT